ncbi:MAG: hypothetical protein Q7T56_02330 [Nocardioidaceae bacterium]|nr:hypothetical protein [Nocardioidaceae bacterium]
MTTLLPFQAARYLDAVERDDVDAALSCLAPGATVVDEGRSHTGDDVRTWLTTTSSEFTFTRDFRGLEPLDEHRSVARFHLEGDFPGGVVDLRFTFTTGADGLVTRLEIAP